MAHQWRGVIREYADRLPMLAGAPTVTLLEGGTPLIPAAYLSERVGAQVWLKFEGLNPTGSFKDRGMTTAISVAAARGAKVVICASTGNTSASAAAYATKAGMACAVLVPDGKIAMGKLSQAVAHGATLLQVEGNFDDCLNVARKLAEAYPVELVNSVNPARIEGQKTAAFEIVDALGEVCRGDEWGAALEEGDDRGTGEHRQPIGILADDPAPLVGHVRHLPHA